MSPADRCTCVLCSHSCSLPVQSFWYWASTDFTSPQIAVHRQLVCIQGKEKNLIGQREKISVVVVFHASHPVFFYPLDESFLWYHHSVADVRYREVRFAHLVGTNSISFVSPQERKLTHSAVLPLPTEPASLGFGGNPSWCWGTAAVRRSFCNWILSLLQSPVEIFRTVCPLKLKFCKTSD